MYGRKVSIELYDATFLVAMGRMMLPFIIEFNRISEGNLL